jgi:hypothetical protein
MHQLNSKCGSWRIEWGQGSVRPHHYMLYHESGEYVGTFLTLSAARRQARMWDGRPLAWRRLVGSPKGRQDSFQKRHRLNLSRLGST